MGLKDFVLKVILPKDEFRAQLELGLARVAFMGKKWADAESSGTPRCSRSIRSQNQHPKLFTGKA